MKKYLSIGLPLVAILVIGFFAFRWYRERTAERLNVPEVTAGTEIENLSNSELEALAQQQKGLGNFKVLTMASEVEEGQGEIRYEIKDDRVLFTVIANLDTHNHQTYQLWLKEALGTEFTASKLLVENKGGLQASTMVAVEKLPIMIEVRAGENTVLSGEITLE